MKKLRLESLEVESFETAGSALDPGTVHAYVVSNARCNSAVSCLPDTCYFDTCMDCVPTVGGCTIDQTCAALCTYTEGSSCLGTCGGGTCPTSLPTCGATCDDPTCGSTCPVGC